MRVKNYLCLCMIVPVIASASEAGQSNEYSSDEQFLEFLAIYETSDGKWFDPQELEFLDERELQDGDNKHE